LRSPHHRRLNAAAQRPGRSFGAAPGSMPADRCAAIFRARSAGGLEHARVAQCTLPSSRPRRFAAHPGSTAAGECASCRPWLYMSGSTCPNASSRPHRRPRRRPRAVLESGGCLMALRSRISAATVSRCGTGQDRDHRRPTRRPHRAQLSRLRANAAVPHAGACDGPSALRPRRQYSRSTGYEGVWPPSPAHAIPSMVPCRFVQLPPYRVDYIVRDAVLKAIGTITRRAALPTRNSPMHRP